MIWLSLNDNMINYLSGVCGGVAVVLVGHPFDTTKTRLQSAPPGVYISTLDCVEKTYAKKGIKGFYSGMGSPLLGQMFFRAISFATFFRTADFLSNGEELPPSRNLVLSGAFTGFLISIIETPIDLIKTKLQIQILKSSKSQATYSSVYTCARYIIRTHGVRALWQGLTATIIRNVPANAFFFPVNEVVKREISFARQCSLSELQLPDRLLAGACAGLCYWVGTYPLDVIKGKSQAASFEQRLSWFKCFNEVLSSPLGLRGFAVGLLPCAMRAVPACAAMFATVDYSRQVLGRYKAL